MTTIVHKDPYEWPFPSRKDLMSLQTIKQEDVGFNKVKVRNQDNLSLKVNDIDGAQPCLKAYKFTNKDDYINKKEDIRGASPKPLTRIFNRPVSPLLEQNQDLQLQNKDIKGTQPQINKFITTREPSNPLEPLYKISAFQTRETTPPKFIRDSININVVQKKFYLQKDIDGTRPMPNFTKLRKNVVIYDEIEGAKSKPRFIPRDHIEILDVKDINNYLEFKSNRVTNPLEPSYTVQNENGEKQEIGKIEGSKSRQLHPQTVNKFTSPNLTTQDIEGAQAGTHSQYFLKSQSRKDYREINKIQDVTGAQVGTLKKGMTSVRRTNPLVPTYLIPGNTEIYPQAFQKIQTTRYLKQQCYSIDCKHEHWKKYISLGYEPHIIVYKYKQICKIRPRMTTAQKLDSFLGK